MERHPTWKGECEVIPRWQYQCPTSRLVLGIEHLIDSPRLGVCNVCQGYALYCGGKLRLKVVALCSLYGDGIQLLGTLYSSTSFFIIAGLKLPESFPKMLGSVLSFSVSTAIIINFRTYRLT